MFYKFSVLMYYKLSTEIVKEIISGGFELEAYAVGFF